MRPCRTVIMLRLKNRQQSPPGGFLFEQSKTGWQNWKVDPPTQWDFFGLCRALQQHRLANQQFKFSTDMAAIEQEVDYANALRVARIPGADTYVINDQMPVPKSPAPAPIRQLQALAVAVNKVSAGADTIEDFDQSGARPVSKEQSEIRAGICVTCPQNGKGDLTRWFTVPLSERIRKQIELREGRGLVTTFDDLIGVCEACLCPLKLKVHFPIDLIVKHMDEKTKTELDPKCWILEEMKP